MSLSAAVIDALVATGATVEQLAAAMKADLAEGEVRLADKRAKDAARQRKSRRSRSVTVTPSDAADAPPNDIYSNPPVLSPKASPSPRERGAFPRPEWADDGVWRDFLANRKRKGLTNTATAHRKLLADIERLTDVHWPPGRLLEEATGRGHGAIYPSIKESGDGRSTGNSVAGHRQPAGRAGDGFINAIRESRAIREALPWDADDPKRVQSLTGVG